MFEGGIVCQSHSGESQDATIYEGLHVVDMEFGSPVIVSREQHGKGNPMTTSDVS